jgi:acyl-CoA reductase-like NAD-dependent aldehyde dehydrogenase
MTTRRLFIDGRWDDAAEGETRETRNPATGEVISVVAAGTIADVDRAVAAARRAFDEGPWGPGSAPRERARILHRAAELIRRDRELLAKLETHDSGKLYSDSLEDVDEVAFIFDYYAGWATKTAGSIPPLGPAAMSLVMKEPIGVAGLITPWNFPILMAGQKIAPALAAGCTTVLKPASDTPLTALELARILDEAGLPAGVFNVVTRPGAVLGDALTAHPGVDKISFTGSTEVGIHIQKTAADTLKRVTMELGGKSPNIVFPDADRPHAFEMSAFGIFFNQGECCTAGSRVLVDRSIYDDALEAMVGYAGNIRLGDGMEATTTMGPMISASQRSTVQRYIDLGKESAARLVFEGRLPSDPELSGGFFVPPTIFADVDNRMTIAREEIFGPVMAVIPFTDEDDAIRIANETPYGLAASVWTRDINRALRVSRAIRAGTVWINDSQPVPAEAPFGGYKASGYGRELGASGIDAYLEEKHVYINLG